MRVFAVKVAVIAGLSAVFSALVFGLGLPPLAAGLVLTGYAVALLLAASQTTMRRDVT
jgi:hypothetical protein